MPETVKRFIQFCEYLSEKHRGSLDLPTVKKFMGHAGIETTMFYSHLADEHVDKAVEKLEF